MAPDAEESRQLTEWAGSGSTPASLGGLVQSLILWGAGRPAWEGPHSSPTARPPPFSFPQAPLHFMFQAESLLVAGNI